MALVVKSPPPNAGDEMWVQSLGGEDPLEEGMATHSSILAWRIPRTEEPGRLQPMGSQRVGQDGSTQAHTHWELRSHNPHSTAKNRVQRGDDGGLKQGVLVEMKRHGEIQGFFEETKSIGPSD